MDGFDLRTITTVFLFISVFRIVMTALICSRNGRKYPGLYYFLAESATYGAAQFLLIMRDRLPDALSIVAGNELVLISVVLTISGIVRLSGRKTSLVPDIAMLAAGLAAFILLTYAYPSLRLRAIAFNIVLLYLCARTVLLVRSEEDLESRSILRGIEVLFSLLVIGIAGRLVNLCFADIPESFFALRNTMEALFILLGNLAEIAQTFAVQSIINRKLAGEVSETLQEKETLLKALETKAATDSLTGAWNRAKLDSLIEAEISRAERYGTPFSVIILDIDHFKSINDNMGHLEGDDVLVEVTRAIKGSMRTGDLLGRWGGDEFLIVCPGTGSADAHSFAETLRRRTAGITSVTISLGVAEWRPGELTKDTVRRADDALYRAKTGGRNRAEAAV